jgi:hypothetical protein
MKKFLSMIVLASIVVACSDDPEIDANVSRKIDIFAKTELLVLSSALTGSNFCGDPMKRLAYLVM